MAATAAATLLQVVVLLFTYTGAEQLRKTHRVTAHSASVSSRTKQVGCAAGVNYRFERYVPSKWEESSVMLNENACQQIHSAEAEVAKWLNHTKTPGGGAGTQSFDDAIFSRFVLRNVCNGARADDVVIVPVEPLIGHLRHPYAVCAPSVAKLDLTYLLMHAWPMDAFLANYPGRRYLFDMGTSTFDTSLRFLTDKYRQAGIVFDEIWAWELAGYDPKTYWSRVPDDYVGRLHFYNTGFDTNTSHAAHPMNMIRAIYKPGDVVIIKLDIDNAELELSVMKEIEDNPDLLRMITEMYFEAHYDHSDMAGDFGLSNGMTLTDVTARFKALRRAGLILHYWP